MTREQVRSEPPWSHPAIMVAVVVAFACVLLSVSFRAYDYDVWQHLVYGKALWASGAVPHAQLWTWPDHGVPVVNPSWGFSALLWPVWNALGEPGLALWRWLTTLAAFALLYCSSRALGARRLAALTVLVLVGLVYRQRSQVRPETLAAVLLAAELGLLSIRGRITSPRAAALVAIVWLWANVHVSFFLGLFLIAARMVCDWFEHAPERDTPRRGLLPVFAVACASVFVNPFGPDAVLRPVRFANEWRSDEFMSGISELRPLDWSVNLSNGLPLLMLGWPLLLLWGWRRRGFDAFEAACCVVFTAVAFSGNRFVAIYALVAAPFVARGFSDCLDSRLGDWGGRAVWRDTLLFAVAWVAACAFEWTHYENRFGIAVDYRRLPVAACDFMQAHDVRGRGINDFYLGGYQLWRFWPDQGRLPFFDIHPEDKPAALRAAYLGAFTSRRGWDALDRRFRFDYALLSRSDIDRAGLCDLLGMLPEWSLVFVDDAAALSVRRDGPLAAQASSQGYRVLPAGRRDLQRLIANAAADSALAGTLRAELRREAASSGYTTTFAGLRAALGVEPAR